MKLKISNLLVLSVLLTGIIHAGGFQLNEHGARAMGLGGAFTAVADDPSAMYFNGAGLTQLSGLNIMLGTAFIAPVSTFRGVTPAVTEYKTKAQTFVVPHGYITYGINSDWAAGVGFNVPFGLGTEWPDKWPGQYLAEKTDVRAYTISAELAHKVIDELSVSAGFVFSFADVTITQYSSLKPFPGDAFVTLTGKDKSAFGYSFGVLYKPLKELSFGASFHSQIKYNFTGTVVTTSNTPQLGFELPQNGIAANLTTPMNLTIGTAYEFMPELKVSLDFQYIGWSSYDTLAIEFSQPSSRKASPRLYDNSFIIRLGAEYKYSNSLSFQGGIYFDKNPVKDENINPSLPDANRICFSLGLNYNLTKNLSAAVSYLFIRSSELTVTNSSQPYISNNPDYSSAFNGTYNSYANIGSISLSYNF